MANSRCNSSITYDPSTQTYQVNYDGKTIQTTLTTQASVIDNWIQEVMLSSRTQSPAIVGLDVEWRSNCNKTMMLQLCLDTKCLIIHLLYIDCIPQSLKDFLLSREFVFVGSEVVEDNGKLMVDNYGLWCRNMDYLRIPGMRRWAYGSWTPELTQWGPEVSRLRTEKTKRVKLSDWQKRELTKELVYYACLDAYAAYKMGSILLN